MFMCDTYSTGCDAVRCVQGMNFVAGALLLFMCEEDVFWALTVVVEDLLPGYFAIDLIAAQVDQLVFKHLVRPPCSHAARCSIAAPFAALPSE